MWQDIQCHEKRHLLLRRRLQSWVEEEEQQNKNVDAGIPENFNLANDSNKNLENDSNNPLKDTNNPLKGRINPLKDITAQTCNEKRRVSSLATLQNNKENKRISRMIQAEISFEENSVTNYEAEQLKTIVCEGKEERGERKVDSRSEEVKKVSQNKSDEEKLWRSLAPVFHVATLLGETRNAVLQYLATAAVSSANTHLFVPAIR